VGLETRPAIAGKANATMIRASIIALAITCIAGAAVGDPAEFHAYLLPELSRIGINGYADVTFEVDSTGVQFNGYEVTIQYDPTIIMLLVVEEGQLMTGACGNTFFRTTETPNAVTVTHVILCGQNPASLDGPGLLTLYRFRGIAHGESPVTIISDPDSTFADAGTPINPEHPTFPRQVFFHHALVRVEESSAVHVDAPEQRLVLAQNVPNPFNPATEIRYRSSRAGPVALEIFDPRGRRVWQRTWSQQSAGEHVVHWQARSRDGEPLASGVYLYRISTASGSLTRKMTLIR
jgi:hypothetical protein